MYSAVIKNSNDGIMCMPKLFILLKATVGKAK